MSIFLKPDFAVVPISANDAVVSALKENGVEVKQTKIGSPYIVAVMNAKKEADEKAKVVGWESNGGFLLGSDWQINGNQLKALPTRDAVLPIIATLSLAINEGVSVSELIADKLPKRYTHADVIDDKTAGCEKYTAAMGKTLVKMFSPEDGNVQQVDFGDEISVYDDAGFHKASDEEVAEVLEIKNKLGKYFSEANGFSDIVSVNFIDGIRITFAGGDVAHIRPSGNAPEFRMYATADTKNRADDIVEARKKIVPEMVKDLG